MLALLAADVASADGYVLDTGDVVRISVLGEATYPLEVVVDDRGAISLPLLGDVEARGLTPIALSRDIQRAFQQRKLILNPYVKVEIGQYRPFFISGAVAHPGSYPFQPGITVRHALALAGGFRPQTAGASVPALQIADLRSERANLTIEEYRLKVKLARLHAESRLADTFVVPRDPPTELGQSLIDNIVGTEQAQMEARLAAFRDDISYLEASLARVKKEVEMIASARAEQESTAKNHLEELESVRSLREKGLITNSNVMALERAHNNYRLDLAQSELQQARVQQELLNLESELRKKRQTHEFQLIADIQDTQVALAKLASQLKYLTDKLLYVFEYGEHRTLDDLQGSVKFSIFRRGQKAGQQLVADENTEVRAGDVVEVSVVASRGFYVPGASRPNPAAGTDKKGF
ncbi:polysaccharide biosynthesis/export family protein [Ensifer sp. BR816]|uniref:polysaccharide biosynthesis/export family protein n=1 Tax=Rhizobium sp. (strain BR816) TaxID=1057002 RepID=UPI0012F71F41|nr:polysaccharide biosynthesis/export family protein [Ensifer sp. BR816]